MIRRAALLAAVLASALGVGVAAAPQASAVTQTSASLLSARKCWFNSNNYTWVQVILASGDNGYYHRVIANYMGTQTFDQYGNKQGNAESITDWQVRQQSATGSNFGTGNNYHFSPTVRGAYDETTYTSEYNWVHGSGLYVWEWLRRDDGATCSVKYQVT